VQIAVIYSYVISKVLVNKVYQIHWSDTVAVAGSGKICTHRVFFSFAEGDSSGQEFGSIVARFQARLHLD
jgi:hypothetical protein